MKIFGNYAEKFVFNKNSCTFVVLFERYFRSEEDLRGKPEGMLSGCGAVG